jgi:alpha-D-ribose 1-methylphosphonate 5-triphosphate synthase subunit PhnL
VTDTAARLSIRGLSKSFVLHQLRRTVTALDAIDLDITAGQHIVLVGDSGAGKSTLLKCIYRRCRPTHGSIRLDQTELTSLTDPEMAELRQQRIGYVPQAFRSEPRRSVIATVEQSALQRGVSRRDAHDIAAEALRRLNVDQQLWPLYPALLPGGDRQRVSLAAGTLLEPGLLLLDEPATALDSAHREVVLEFIESLSDGRSTIISVLREPDAISRLADRIIALAAGRVTDDQSTPMDQAGVGAFAGLGRRTS